MANNTFKMLKFGQFTPTNKYAEARENLVVVNNTGPTLVIAINNQYETKLFEN